MVDVTLQAGSDVEGSVSAADRLAADEVRQRPALVRAIGGFAYRHAWVLVLSSVIGVYLFTNLLLPKISNEILSPFVRSYVLQPVLWLGVAGGVFIASRYAAAGGPRYTKALLGIGLLLGAFQVSIVVIAALFLGFGRSPYVLAFPGTFINFAFWGSALLAVEMVRGYMIHVLGRRFVISVLVALALLFMILEVPLVRYTSPREALDYVPFVGGALLPSFTEHLLASYLALLGGPVAAIGYRGVLDAFEWLSPILPNLQWLFDGFIGLVIPVVGISVVQTLYATPEEFEEAEPEEEESKGLSIASVAGWVAAAGVSVGVVLFSVGAFGIRPGVVLTGSMSPAIEAGDIVITREIPPHTIQVGDIIQYQQGAIAIWHRVIELRDDGGRRSFIMKGDANNAPDPNPILTHQILGRVVFVVPKLGQVSLELKKLFSNFF